MLVFGRRTGSTDGVSRVHAARAATPADEGATAGGPPEPDDRLPSGSRKGIAMRRIRYLLLAALGVFAALPVARVYTSGAPWIERIELRSNDLKALHGKGVPGTVIDIKIRQRNFRQGSPTTAPLFQWCAWLLGGQALSLGTATVNSLGTWQLTGLDWQVLPGEAAGRTCATGVLSQLELHSQWGDVLVPNLTNLNMTVGSDPTHQRVGGAIQLANQVAIGLADGPNEVQTDPGGLAPWIEDTDEDGVDLCEVG